MNHGQKFMFFKSFFLFYDQEKAGLISTPLITIGCVESHTSRNGMSSFSVSIRHLLEWAHQPLSLLHDIVVRGLKRCLHRRLCSYTPRQCFAEICTSQWMLPEGEEQTATPYIKKGQVQIKTTMRHQLPPLGWLLLKKEKTTSVGEDVGQLGASCSAGGNVKWCSCWKPIWQLLKKLNTELP